MSIFAKQFFTCPLLWLSLWNVVLPSGAHADLPPHHLTTSPPHHPTTSIDPERLARIDTAVQQALEHHDMPGAVVLVLQRGRVVFRKAYGSRSKQPIDVPMTLDTVFDLASLTKPVATATSLLILVERGKLRFSDRVAQYLPAFGQNGKEKIMVEKIMLNTSGLIAYITESC